MNTAVIASLLIFSILVVLLLMGVPIGISLCVASLVVITQSLGFAGAAPASALKMFRGINIFTLLAIPFFILAGNIMNKGGIAIRLIHFATALTGRIPGSLAHTNIVANMLFGAISGSGTAAASAMGSIIGPIEKKEGYDEDFAAAVNVATAPTGLLIPPSTGLITYALASGGTSVAALFLGGYIPGILWGLSCMAVAFFYAKKHGYVTDRRISVEEFVKVTLDAVPSLLLIIIVIGGICGGIFTATEASAVAVLYSLILSVFFYRTLNGKELYSILINSAKMSGIIMFLVGASNIMAWVMSFTGIPDAIAMGVLSISNNKIIILFTINLLLLFVGTFMDLTPAILIFTPILLPVCEKLGMSALHFGIMLVFNLCIGCITPPVGNILFVGIKVAGRKLERVMPLLMRYYLAIFIILMLVTYIPWLSTFLPELAGYH
ncbi:TRAP transporter large permease [Clostridium sp. AM58-1XD]|uniref:TRAP transporter large permease n=1 Tax=Clostridium sp. AM58-1XD TaxID=2292307 RepID=UPI000E4E0D28|nr:TRAP transporter large permease [Clostridium sp. AM58-1XD]RGY97724.1 TRAP transporter large permease [Clostridium sp. AM58-1XD]